MHVLQNHKKLFQLSILITGIILLVITLVNLSILLNRTSIPKGLLFSIDNDAGRAIQTAQLSRWYSSNHFAPYGNLYFRVAHTIAKLSPVEVLENLNPAEKDEVVHHFALKLASLLSLTSLCLFLAWILTQKWEYTIGLSAIFLRCLFHDEILVKYIFRAHPDHMLMLATAVAVFFTFRYLNERTDKNFKLSAIFWGVGFAVKRSLVLFLPSLIFMFLIEGCKKETFKKGYKFAGWMLLSYLFIGFPQNFGFGKHINFMLSETHNSQPADKESVLWYSTLLWNQLKYVLIPILLAHLFWGNRRLIKLRNISIFVFLAIIVMYSRKMMSISEHHTFPYAGMLLIMAVVLIQRIPVLNFKYKEALFAVALLSSAYFVTGNTHAISKVFADQNVCIEENKELLALVKAEQVLGKIMVRDPYIPFDSSKSELTKQFWGLTFKDVETSQPKLIGTNSIFAERYLPSTPPTWWSDEKKLAYDEKNDFYQAVKGKDSVTTPSGKTFIKIYHNNCGNSLWKLKED